MIHFDEKTFWRHFCLMLPCMMINLRRHIFFVSVFKRVFPWHTFMFILNKCHGQYMYVFIILKQTHIRYIVTIKSTRLFLYTSAKQGGICLGLIESCYTRNSCSPPQCINEVRVFVFLKLQYHTYSRETIQNITKQNLRHIQLIHNRLSMLKWIKQSRIRFTYSMMCTFSK